MASLKTLTARSLKWNIADRVSTQVLYAITGIVLARELSPSDFGLVGALLVFQSVALLFVDSGFSWALLQRKNPDDRDYSTVYWFNLAMACFLYGIAWVAMPAIAGLFHGGRELVDLGRVMFLSFPLTALSIVQNNRLTKQMNVRPIAMVNFISLTIGGIVGIVMAVKGFGAWAIIGQTLTLNAAKAVGLGVASKWKPQLYVSWPRLKGYMKVGLGMSGTSLLNVVFQNIYSFFIGNRAGLVPLGYYTQSDKWSKMGITAITQVLTSTFLPALAEVQDEHERFVNVARRIDRFTAYMLFPAMLWLIVMATPLFHLLFGTKWDASIPLFQLLLVRGVFTVLNSLYGNFILSKGHSRAIFLLELLRDSVAIAAIIITLPMITLSTTTNLTSGLQMFLWGQVIASAVTWVVTLIYTARYTKIAALELLADATPYLLVAALAAAAMVGISLLNLSPLATLSLQGIAGVAVYGLICRFIPSSAQTFIIEHLRNRRRDD